MTTPKKHGGRRNYQPGRPRSGDEPTWAMSLKVPASLRAWYKAADGETQRAARAAMVQTLREVKERSEG